MEEKIKESESPIANEPVSAAEEIPVTETAKSHREKQHRVKKLIVEMWPAYLIEILVIILGISITLALEEWRDDNKESRLETVYQKNLLTDIETDVQTLQYATAKTRQIIHKGEELISFINSPLDNPVSAAQVNADLQSILERPKFISSDATFSDLKNSGNLHLLKDIRLKNLLFSFYSLAQNIKEVQDAEQQATISIAGPYFLKRIPMDIAGTKNPVIEGAALQKLAADIEFRNNIVLRIDNRKELLVAYQKADSLAVQVKNALSSAE